MISNPETADITDQFSCVQLRSSVSNADLPISNDKNSSKPNCGGNSQWNPFEDPTPFNQMTEDHIYEAEFDALRDRPNGEFKIKQKYISKFNIVILFFNYLN